MFFYWERIQESVLQGLKDQNVAIDIAWKKDEFIEVPLNRAGKTIKVPKPILMEITLNGINSHAIVAYADAHGLAE